MLYVTTRNSRDVFTVHRALTERRPADGGHYLPFRHPRFSAEELDALLQKPFHQCVAEILNLQFHTKLTGWDIDFCIGRNPVRTTPLRHRILLAECWHTPGYRFDRIVSALSARVGGRAEEVSGWTEIGIRIAVLFGLFSDLRRNGINEADISCVSGDFLMPVSVWYARHWGLPIRNILCCCNENNSLWGLVCHGQMRTDGVCIPTILPGADVAVPVHLERLIYECGGVQETERYLEICRRGGTYCPPESVLSKLRGGISVSVVSSRRLCETIPGLYKTHGVLVSPCTALAYAGLLDHRAKTGSTGYALIWSEESPSAEAETISNILEIPADMLPELL